MGLTKQEIAQKVEERKGYNETEDIYGEIYGNMDTIGDDEVYVVNTLYYPCYKPYMCVYMCVCTCVYVCACALSASV